MDVVQTKNHKQKINKINKQKIKFLKMSGHQSTADMVNNELDQFAEMTNPGLDTMMADMNITQDFSGAPDIHGTLDTNTQFSDMGGHGQNAL